MSAVDTRNVSRDSLFLMADITVDGSAHSVRAKVLLSYGNATQPGSPHFGDQLELFSRKEFRDAWFTDSAIESNTARVEKLEEIQPKSATE